jgi:hypothetical protein
MARIRTRFPDQKGIIFSTSNSFLRLLRFHMLMDGHSEDTICSFHGDVPGGKAAQLQVFLEYPRLSRATEISA